LTLWLVLLQGRTPSYLFTRRLRRSQSYSEYFGEENLLPLLGNKPCFLSFSLWPHHYIEWAVLVSLNHDI
jgi:hypothetical protein